MNISRRLLMGAGAAVALAAGGTGVALATGGNGGETHESEGTPVPAAAAAQAKAAALKITGGGRVTALESDNEHGAAYEVEVTTAAGRSVDVRLDSSFALVGRPEANDDSGEHGDHHDSGDGDGETADDTSGAADRGDGDGETNDDTGPAGKVDRGDGDGETND